MNKYKMLYTKFIDKALGDGSRSNKYDVFFSIDGGQFDKRLSILCQTTKLPAITADTVEYKYKGKSIPLPIGYSYGQEWECNFLLDDNHEIKKFFEEWIERYSTRRENVTYTGKEFSNVRIPGGGTFNKNTIDVKIVQYNFKAEINPYNSNESNATAVYVLHNVFPVSTSDISYGTDDEIETLTVTFKYSHFERVR